MNKGHVNERATTLVRLPVALGLIAIGLVQAMPAFADIQTESMTFIHDCDVAYYEVDGKDAQVRLFEALRARAAELEAQFPKRAEPMALRAWALIGQAGVQRNLGSLALMSEAKDKLEAAIAVDAKVFSGIPYVSLGTLYTKIPTAPFSFGDKPKGIGYFQKGLTLDPKGVEPNSQYAVYLAESGNCADATKHAAVALKAKTRKGREQADTDLREQATKVIARCEARIH